MSQGSLSQRQEQLSGELALHGADEPLDDSDAAVLPDSAKSGTDATAVAPAFEGVAEELRPFVADELLPGAVFIEHFHIAA